MPRLISSRRPLTNPIVGAWLAAPLGAPTSAMAPMAARRLIMSTLTPVAVCQPTNTTCYIEAMDADTGRALSRAKLGILIAAMLLLGLAGWAGFMLMKRST